jgi:hypothetical protein
MQMPNVQLQTYLISGSTDPHALILTAGPSVGVTRGAHTSLSQSVPPRLIGLMLIDVCL